MTNKCGDCEFYQAEVDRMLAAVQRAVAMGVDEEELQALRDSYGIAMDTLNEHVVLGHDERRAVG